MGKVLLELEPEDTRVAAVSLTHLSARIPGSVHDTIRVLELMMEQYKSGENLSLELDLVDSTVLLAAITLTGHEFAGLFHQCHKLVHKFDMSKVNPWEEEPAMVPGIYISICYDFKLCKTHTETINRLGLNPN